MSDVTRILSQIESGELGPSHRNTLTSMLDLAVGYARAQRRDEALTLEEAALKRCQVELGVNDALTRRAMNSLAVRYQATGRKEQAAALRTSLGQHAEAVKLFEEILTVRKAKDGPDHPATLMTMHHLANACAALGRHDEALKVREESLKLRKAKLGAGHADTVSSMYRISLSYTSLGRYAEARQILEEALEHAQANSPPQQNAIMKCSYQLSCVLALTLPEAADKDEQAKQAVAYLRAAAAADAVDPAQWKRDENLAALRGRSDFQEFLTNLESKQSPKK